jgi:hypothetical protein
MHEPDCFYSFVPFDPRPTMHCGGCITAKKAYRRGRNDAANDLADFVFADDCDIDKQDAIDVVRGDNDA